MLGRREYVYGEINPFCDLPWEFQILIPLMQRRGTGLWSALMIQIQPIGDLK